MPSTIETSSNCPPPPSPPHLFSSFSCGKFILLFASVDGLHCVSLHCISLLLEVTLKFAVFCCSATLMWGPRMQPPCGGPWGVLTWVGPANASKASPRLRLTAHMTASVSNREMPCRAASRSYLGRAGAGLRWCLGKERCLARQCLLGRCWSFASQPHLGWNHAAALVQ